MQKAMVNMMRSFDVKEDDIEKIVSKYKGKVLDTAQCDKELIKLGYPAIFSVFEDDDEYYYEDYDSFEKNPSRSFDDDFE